MAKKTKAAAPNAAQQAAAQQVAPEAKTVEQPKTDNKSQIAVIQLGDLDKLAQARALAGLDPNHAEDLIARLDDRFFKDPHAATRYNIAQSTVDKINEITARGMIALLANEVEMAQTPFAIRMRQESLDQLREAAADMKIVFDTKALPAPDNNGFVEVPSTAIQPTEEAKKAMKEEREATSGTVELDPTKIEDEKSLKKALLSILVKGNGSSNIYDKVMTAINFYKAYCEIQAEKSEDPNKAHAALEEKSRVDFLMEISKLLGKCTFTLSGITKIMYEHTERTKSPVVAFCMLRDASLNKKTGAPQIEDQVIADIVKVFIRWYADSEIAVTKETIASMEKDLDLLKKDEKKNAKGIESGKKVIESAKRHIDAVEKVVKCVNVPSREIIDNFPANYKDSKAEGFKAARMIGSKIIKTYYGDIALKNFKADCLIHNMQQYMGIISNMFLPPMESMPEFCEANITELEKEEVAAEEKPKNE